MRVFFVFFVFILFQNIQAQITDFSEKFTLPNELEETSGLLFIGNRIISHNDSGDGAKLYELDSINGNIVRTITISNAANIDWEDITQNDTHIFVGDIGNNVGNRQDLRVYKILKSDFLTSTQVTSEIISFSYEDQVDFSSQFNNHNFDAEAIVHYENSLLIFTKNWVDLKTNVYKIPDTAGTHSALKISTANIEGLITGATYDNGNFLLCGYNTNFVPFLVHISFNRAPGDDIFSSGFDKTLLVSELELGSQTEAITRFDIGKFYISRESVNTTIQGNPVNLPQKLYQFTDNRDFVLSTTTYNNINVQLSPNPISDVFTLTSSQFKISRIDIYDPLGKEVFSEIDPKKEVDISRLKSGMYILKVFLHNNNIIEKKIIKN